jgi:hypothetical protein
MGVLYSPKIVTNGLVLCLDAGNRKSYSGSGNIWRDISGNEEHFILYNNPVFNRNSNGSPAIEFSANNDYARRTNSNIIKRTNNNGTIDIWFRSINNDLNAASTSYARIISVADAAGTGSDNSSTQGSNRDYSDFYCLAVNNQDNVQNFALWYGGNPSAFSTNPVILFNTTRYFNIVITYSSSGGNMTFNYFVQGRVARNSSVITRSGYSTDASTITLGMNSFGALTNVAENSQTAISQIKLYDIALNATQVLQNYNALKGRFNL